MSDNRPEIPRPPQAIARDRAGEWFLGNFHRGAVLRLRTDTRSSIQVDIEPGKVGKPEQTVAGIFNLRRASAIRNGVKLPGVAYVGLEYHNGMLGYFDHTKRLLDTSSSVKVVVDIEPVSQVTRV